MTYFELTNDNSDFWTKVRQELYRRTNNASECANHGVPIDEMEKLYKVISALSYAKVFGKSVDVAPNILTFTPEAIVDHMLEWAEKCQFSNMFLLETSSGVSHRDSDKYVDELNVLFSLKKDDWI